MGYKILHITPHLGGGVGSVVLNWMNKDTGGNTHTILSLDKNKNSDWVTVKGQNNNVKIVDDFYKNFNLNENLTQYIRESDIVLVHWWNHPLLYDILINFIWPPCRLVMWNHVTGLYPPYVISEKVIDFCDMFIFTSPVSYESTEIAKLPDNKKGKLDTIWSTIGVESFIDLPREQHDNFIVGFTGTVDFGKLHPEYIKMCSAINIPNVRFVVCSGDPQEHLIRQAKERGVYNKFDFKGRVPSIVPYVASFDVFGYPLQPQHYATCEQALGEAMMAGCVPVVLNNPTERYIIQNGKTGIVAESCEEYSRAIEYLYQRPDIRKKMAINAQEYARKQYDINKTINKWNIVFDKLYNLEKKLHSWGNARTFLPYELYIESLGQSGEVLRRFNEAANDDLSQEVRSLFNSNSMFKSKSKGSVFQYLSFFPNDEILAKWSVLAK